MLPIITWLPRNHSVSVSYYLLARNSVRLYDVLPPNILHKEIHKTTTEEHISHNNSTILPPFHDFCSSSDQVYWFSPGVYSTVARNNQAVVAGRRRSSKKETPHSTLMIIIYSTFKSVLYSTFLQYYI
jgi:hypothetical protein